MRSTLVLNVVGMTPSLLAHAPHLQALARQGVARPLLTVAPAVTTTVQASMLTGRMPSEHGIVGNGWYFRELSEIWFWRQCNRLVMGDKVWDEARRRDSRFTVAKLFWWYNMYADVDWSVSPRPVYTADGLKFPDLYTQPPEMRDELTQQLGPFPFFQFWGPKSGIESSDWIVRSTLALMREKEPTMALAYLPHLDYSLQKWGPSDPRIPQEVAAVDAVCGELIEAARKEGRAVTVVSEYGITAVQKPVHINRVLRQAGLLAVRLERGREMLDAGASRAFAVADHQVAHVYVRNSRDIQLVRDLLLGLDGVERVLDADGMSSLGLNHPRSGELFVVARSNSWFTYYHFLDDAKAPDYARTVDIHRKPGYDPLELFIDPQLRWPALRVAWRLAQKKLGMRYLMDVIPLDAALVKGSHGRITDDPNEGPLLITDAPESLSNEAFKATDVFQLLLDQTFGQQ